MDASLVFYVEDAENPPPDAHVVAKRKKKHAKETLEMVQQDKSHVVRQHKFVL